MNELKIIELIKDNSIEKKKDESIADKSWQPRPGYHGNALVILFFPPFPQFSQ